ncbi:MAG TPA: CDP-glycerol glycerophosphotransferase family protein, partial [Nocardioides sp.]|uniref:CDP-glycerol glycerophosphotransferase family protein n=1 Tax=Nocardioides sp. TaxID=35761 RepID=UPI002ED8F83D
ALDLSPHRHPALPPVLRAADVLVTDHSGLGLDFLVTGRPVVGFAPNLAPDLAPAAEAILDPILDPGHVLPGPVCRDAASLVQALGHALEQAIEPGATPSPHYARVRDLLLDRVDADSTARVLARLDAVRGRTR